MVVCVWCWCRKVSNQLQIDSKNGNVWMTAEGAAGTEAGGGALERCSGVEKDSNTGKREEETGRNGLCELMNHPYCMLHMTCCIMVLFFPLFSTTLCFCCTLLQTWYHITWMIGNSMPPPMAVWLWHTIQMLHAMCAGQALWYVWLWWRVSVLPACVCFTHGGRWLLR